MIAYAVWDSWELVDIFTSEKIADAYASTDDHYEVKEFEIDVESSVEKAQEVLESRGFLMRVYDVVYADYTNHKVKDV